MLPPDITRYSGAPKGFNGSSSSGNLQFSSISYTGKFHDHLVWHYTSHFLKIVLPFRSPKLIVGITVDLIIYIPFVH